MGTPRLVTVGVIAAEYGCSVTRVRYVLTKRPNIRVVAVAGNARLFDRAAVAAIVTELKTIDACRAVREGVNA